MSTTIEAVYEGGIFGPTQAVTLLEGTQVEVLLPEDPVDGDPRDVAARLLEIAKDSITRNISEDSSENHDDILYGRQQHP